MQMPIMAEAVFMAGFIAFKARSVKAEKRWRQRDTVAEKAHSPDLPHRLTEIN
jgi:hypothetical protein